MIPPLIKLYGLWASVREYFSPSRSGLFFQFHPETEKDNKDPANPACPVAPEDGTGINPV